MNISLKNLVSKSFSQRRKENSLFSPREEASPLQRLKDNSGTQERNFFQVIYNRITKKKFLVKQKLKFILSLDNNYQGEEHDDLEILRHKVKVLEDILRHIREKSVHKIMIKPIKEAFEDDPEIIAYAIKLREYQVKFLSHLLRKKRKNDTEIKSLERIDSSQRDSLLGKILRGNIQVKPFKEDRMEKAKSCMKRRKEYYRTQMSKSVRFNRSPVKWQQRGSAFMKNSDSYFHNVRSVERRFCPPVPTPDLLFARKSRLGFANQFEKNRRSALR